MTKTYTTRKGRTLTYCCHRPPEHCTCRIRGSLQRRPRRRRAREAPIDRWARLYLDSEGRVDTMPDETGDR